MKKKIIVLGGKGQLATCIRKMTMVNYNTHEFVFLGHDEVDITNYKQLDGYIGSRHEEISAVINCAAYTNVNKANEDGDTCRAINELGVQFIVSICRQYNIPLVHISTNYIFDGMSLNPYKEDDVPNPINEYGNSKYMGEKIIQKSGYEKYVIIRTGWVFSPYGQNFFTKIMKKLEGKERINLPHNFFGTPTSGLDLADFVLEMTFKLIRDRLSYKIYNFTNSGLCSWYDFGKTIAMFTGHELMGVYPIQDANHNDVNRPQNSTLDLSRTIQETGRVPKHWIHGVIDVIRKSEYSHEYRLPLICY